MTTFQAYLDDSGSGKPVFVLSGYVSSVDFWEAFSEDWQKLLDEPPQLPYFKMREAVKGFGGRMGQRAANERIKKFLHLIWCASHASVSCIIPMHHWDRCAKGKVPKRLDDPYFLAIFDLVVKIIDNQIAVRSMDVVDFIFDDNPRLAAKVPAYYQLTRQLLSPQFRALIGTSPRFESDLEFLPLQAGDAQSWYFRRLFAEKFKGIPFPKNVPKAMFGELDRVRSLLSYWFPQRLENWAQNVNRTTVSRPAEEWQPRRFRDIHDLIANFDVE